MDGSTWLWTSLRKQAGQGEGSSGLQFDHLVAREAAWRAFYGGDVKTLGDLLPPECIGIGKWWHPGRHLDLPSGPASARP